MDKFVKRVKVWSGVSRKPSTPELSRSQYSLVSTGELTAEALQVWLKLPRKIKYDPELESFQKCYEKEIANQENIPLKLKNGSTPETKRLPLVKSAPHLNNNRIDESPSADGKLDGVEIHSPGKQDASLENHSTSRYPKLAKAGHYVKMTLLLSGWVFFTLIFMLYNEKEEITRNSSVNPGEIKNGIIRHNLDVASANSIKPITADSHNQ